MPSAPAPSPTEIEVGCIRELSREGRYAEALGAAEALAVAAPQSREALYLVAANQRCLNRALEALDTLQLLEARHPSYSLLYQERGYCHVTLRDAPRAIEAFSRAVSLNPALAASWRMLEHLYRMTGEEEPAEAAAGQVSTLQNLPPEVVRAGSLFSDCDLPSAEKILREYLSKGGGHVEALRLLARIEHHRGVLEDAEWLLKSALSAAPGYLAARVDYVRVLLDRQKYLQAHQETDIFLGLEPRNEHYLLLRAAACAGLGRHEQAVELYRRLLTDGPESSELYVALGHSLKSAARLTEAIESYRKAAAARAGFGDAWWSLANLKTYCFSDDEITIMRGQEAAPDVPPVDRYHLCFALGKAYEDRNDYAESWLLYERGNRLKRAESRYDPTIIEDETRKQIDLCTARFFAARQGVGAPAPDPIFIVGLPRSGSTLIEQILASHSQIEGTQELPDIPRLVQELERPRPDLAGPRYPNTCLDSRYPEVLRDLEPSECRRLGERYLSDTRVYRGDKPFFIDKMPNNFRFIGLIHLILPNAKIIDVRREPMACCLSNLKQLFARGQEFTYSIDDIARYYRTYLEVMRHWDDVLPGRVLRVHYEDVVEDLAGNVRRFLDFCGLEFEAPCVEYYKTDRSVRTPSSEQVRRPIFREGLSSWRNYEPWLDPLKSALGDAPTSWRERANRHPATNGAP